MEAELLRKAIYELGYELNNRPAWVESLSGNPGTHESRVRSLTNLENNFFPMEKFICIHGHFYQPPRENPWLETVELQDSAAPYHDWNERVTAECYAPNAHARLVDGRRPHRAHRQ